MGDIVPRNQLVKQGVQGIAGVGGGIGLLVLRAIAAIGEGALSLPGLIYHFLKSNSFFNINKFNFTLFFRYYQIRIRLIFKKDLSFFNFLPIVNFKY